MTRPILSVQLRSERDIVLARQRARHIAALLGFEPREQTAIATAVSELARNAVEYAGGGSVRFLLAGQPAALLQVRVVDRGPGMRNLQAVLDGTYRSATGMGLGIVGARRLMDGFEIHSEPGAGTEVTLEKRLRARAGVITPERVRDIANELTRINLEDPTQEVQQQNQELLQTLDELRTRQAEIERLNSELHETNRGVVALYRELDERAEVLQRASELKSRFL
ncbi:MAG TPA: ATP-binding protein, partial [Armatimonadota bacterium]|nr:ATP-binding protein [Armatimonadota bacterium]